MSTETWSDEPAPPSPAAGGVEPAPGAGPLARITVLPRVERQGASAQLVRAHEPRYDGIEELGRGGLGVVLGARDRDIGRRVAIKQLRVDRSSPRALLRFAEEIRTVGRLDHPNIVPIHDVGTDAAGQPYFVMKYVSGATMAEVIDQLRRGDERATARWTQARRLEVFQKVLEAVAFAHAHGVVHRDLKPENIMLGEHGAVHVVDWGIALRDTSPDLSGFEGDEPQDARVTHTRVGAVIGTPHYMSPEQAQGQGCGPPSDVYSLAVICHEWLGETHYLEDLSEVEAVLAAVLHRPVARPHGSAAIPPDLGWMIVAAAHKDPAERPTAAAWVDRMLRRADGDIDMQCMATMQKQVMHRMERIVDRRPVLWTLGVLGAVGAGAGVAAVVSAIALTGAFLLGGALL